MILFKIESLHARFQGRLGPFSQNILSLPVILSAENTMVSKVISELKSIYRLYFFQKANIMFYG